MAKPTSSRLEVAEEDAPRATATGTAFRLHEDSQGMRILTEIRDAEPGSDREAELVHKLGKLEDANKIVTAVTELVGTATRLGRGLKALLAVLAAAITTNPLIDAAVHNDSDALKRIETKLDAGKEERRALAAWLWDIERCRQDPVKNPCPTDPPAPIRIMLAEDELGR